MIKKRTIWLVVVLLVLSLVVLAEEPTTEKTSDSSPLEENPLSSSQPTAFEGVVEKDCSGFFGTIGCWLFGTGDGEKALIGKTGGVWGGGEALVGKAGEEDKTEAEKLIKEGKELKEEKDYSGAIKKFEGAVKKAKVKGEEGEAWFQIALIKNYNFEEYGGAAEAYGKAAEAYKKQYGENHETEVQQRMWQIEMLEKAGEMEEAKKVFEENQVGLQKHESDFFKANRGKYGVDGEAIPASESEPALEPVVEEESPASGPDCQGVCDWAKVGEQTVFFNTKEKYWCLNKDDCAKSKLTEGTVIKMKKEAQENEKIYYVGKGGKPLSNLPQTEKTYADLPVGTKVKLELPDGKVVYEKKGGNSWVVVESIGEHVALGEENKDGDMGVLANVDLVSVPEEAITGKEDTVKVEPVPAVEPAPEPEPEILSAVPLAPSTVGKTPAEKISDLAAWLEWHETKIEGYKKGIEKLEEELKKETDPDKKYRLEEEIKVEKKILKDAEKSYEEAQEKAEKEAEEIMDDLNDEEKAKIGKAVFEELELAKKAVEVQEEMVENQETDWKEAEKEAKKLEKEAKKLEKKAETAETAAEGKEIDSLEAEAAAEAKKLANAAKTKADEAKTNAETEKTNLETMKKNLTETKEKKAAAERKLEFVGEVTGTTWVGGSVLRYALSFITTTPRYPALTNALFKDAEWYQNWKKGVDQTFANVYLGGYLEAKMCDSKFNVKPSSGTGAAYIESYGRYQFVGSIQAERSPNKNQLLLCDEEHACPVTNGLKNPVCKENLCYKDVSATKPEKGYFYKITWSVTAPSDLSWTIREDEDREEVDFNLQIDGKTWLFKDNQTKQGGKNAVHLEAGRSSRSLDLPPVIVEYSPDLYNQVCVVFGKNKPKGSKGLKGTGGEISKFCADFIQSTLGEVNFKEGVGGDGSGASQTEDSNVFCGLDGVC